MYFKHDFIRSTSFSDVSLSGLKPKAMTLLECEKNYFLKQDQH